MSPSAPQLTDAQLLDQTRAGDMAAYDELYRRHLRDARRVARIITDDNEEADDVVAEAFARVLAKLREGAGPDGAMTPYLRTVIRRLAVDRHRASSREDHPADPAMLEELPTADDEIARVTDRQLVRAAFESLPERWQRVLWHTEIEGRPPATLTPTLGSSPNAVAALAYRAREGLRQAFLAVHLTSTAPPECRPFVPKLAAYIRQVLPEKEDVAVAIHLDTCTHCRERRDELLLLVSDVRGVLAPALLGVLMASSGVAAAAPAGAAALAGVGAATGGEAAGGVARLRPRGVLQIAATSVVSAAAAAAVAFAAVSAMSQPSRSGEPAAAPPPVTSQYQPATVATPSPTPTPEPTETPSPTEDSADGEETAPADAPPAAQPPAARQSQASSPAADDAPSEDAPASAEPEPERPPRSGPPNDPPPKPSPRPDPEPDPQPDPEPKPKPDPGTPPPSPWVCQVLPLLPWCD